MELNEKTHDEFFRVITRKKLNELFLRASNPDILQKQINANLSVGYVFVKVNRKSNECLIIFNYLSNAINQGHITLHFKKADKINNMKWGNPNINIGRFHLKNNVLKNKKYTMRINKQGNDKIQMYLTHRATNIRPELKVFTDAVLDILNMYLDPLSNEYLGHYKFPNQIHPCIAILDKEMIRTKTQLRNTRKKAYSALPSHTPRVLSASYKNILSPSGIQTPSKES
jgi:hypothetical protein